MAIDEATAAVLAAAAETGAPPLHELSPQEGREVIAAMSALSGPGPEVATVYNEQVTTGDGDQFTVRVLVPAGDIRALVVYFHGGGWVIGDLDTHDHLVRVLANRLQSAFVNVEYRLAPEHRFPTAADDSWAALLIDHHRIDGEASRHGKTIECLLGAARKKILAGVREMTWKETYAARCSVWAIRSPAVPPP